MAYRLAWIIAVALLAGLAIWLFRSIEPYQADQYVGYQGEAATNPLFAASLYLEARSRPVKSVRSVPEMFPLPSTDVTLIVSAERYNMADARNDELLEWTRQGGHLWLVGRSCWYECEADDDPLVGAFGARMEEMDYDEVDEESATVVDEVSESDPESSDSSELSELADEAEVVEDNAALQTELGAGAVPELRLNWPVGSQNLIWDAAGPTDVLVKDSSGSINILGSRRFGEGRVLVMQDLDMFANWGLERLDNAALLWWLINLDRQPAEVWMVLSDDMPPLWRWLLSYASPLLVSLLVLAGLVGWATMTRFGPPAPYAPTQTRSLAEHIKGAAHYYHRTRTLQLPLTGLQRQTWSRIRRKWPQVGEEPATADFDDVSAALGIGVDDLGRAFASDQTVFNTLAALKVVRDRL